MKGYTQYLKGLVLIFILLWLTGCQKSEPINIGVIGTMTGPNSDLSVSGRRGIEMALDEINKNGGLLSRDVVMNVMDDLNDSEVALEAFKTFAEDNIHLVVGPFTSGMIVNNIEAVNKLDLLVFGPTISADNLSGLDDRFIRLIASTKEQAVVIAKQVERDGISTCMVVYDRRNEGFTESLVKHFEKKMKDLGITCTTLGINPQDDLAVDQVLEIFETSKPEGIFVITSAEDVASLSQKLHLINSQAFIYAPLWANTPELIKKGGKAVEHIRVVGAIDLEESSPTFNTFRKTFINRYGEEPTFASVYAYEAMMVMAEAIASTESVDAEKIKAHIIEKREYVGLEGVFEIDEYGDNIRDYMIFENINGTFRKVF